MYVIWYIFSSTAKEAEIKAFLKKKRGNENFFSGTDVKTPGHEFNILGFAPFLLMKKQLSSAEFLICSSHFPLHFHGVDF